MLFYTVLSILFSLYVRNGMWKHITEVFDTKLTMHKNNVCDVSVEEVKVESNVIRGNGRNFYKVRVA